MGKRFQEFGQGKSDRDYITAMRDLSQSIQKSGETVLQQLTQKLISVWDILKVELDLKTQKLPFRPLVYGGDDITFVCDGRLGLTLAAHALHLFETQPIADGQPLTACAGISIVKAHYPFARAYKLSEALCQSAKKVAKRDRKLADKRLEPVSAIDWHIANSGLLGDLTEIRNREYRSQDNQSLAMRPLLLPANQSDWQNWENFEYIIHGFTKEEWKSKRNKVKALREVLRIGPEATKEFLTAYQLTTLPVIPGSDRRLKSPLAEQGWLDNTCGYFDAIEAMDFYIPLGGES
jgi:hypothetical protein